jgi:Secretion system C-terminal sorting domain/PKD domain
MILLVSLFTPRIGRAQTVMLECLPNPLSAGLVFSPGNPCEFTAFFDFVEPGVVSAIWVLDAGTAQEQIFPTFTAINSEFNGTLLTNNCGTHTVKVTVVYGNGFEVSYNCNFESACTQVTPCVLGITPQFRTDCSLDFVHDPQFAQAGSQWSYDFGDDYPPIQGLYGESILNGLGTFGTFNNPLHVYQEDGTYIVHVIYTSPDQQTIIECCFPVEISDCKNTDLRCEDINIQIQYPTPCSVTFTPSSSYDLSQVYWEYNFGDNSPSIEGPYGQAVTGSTSTSGTWDTPTHIYSQAGTYIVTLTFLGEGGVPKECTYSVVVTNCDPVSNCNFQASFNIDCAELLVSVNAEETSPGQNHIWNFGIAGEALIEGDNVSLTHQYANINTYQPNNVVTITHTLNGQVCPVEFNFPEEAIFLSAAGGNCESALSLLTCLQLPGNTCLNRTLYIASHLNVDKNFSFDNCDIFMGANKRIRVVGPGTGWRNFSLDNGTSVGTGTVEQCNCMWEGIQVQDRARVYINSMWPDATDLEEEVTIRDAVLALRPMRTTNSGLPQVWLDKSRFNDNFVGFCAVNGNYSFKEFLNITFEGTQNLKNGCSEICPFVNPIQNSFPYSISFPLAGVLVDGRTVTPVNNFANNAHIVMPTGTSNIIFNNINSGIIANDANATIFESTFTDIWRHGNYALIPNNQPQPAGFGIRFMNGSTQPKALDQTGYGGTSIAPLSFDNVHDAIFASSDNGNLQTTVRIDDNHMNRVQRGITLNAAITTVGTPPTSTGSNITNGIVVNNTININNTLGTSGIFPGSDPASSHAVFITDQFSGASTYVVDGNTVRVNQPDILAGGEEQANGIFVTCAPPMPPAMPIGVNDQNMVYVTDNNITVISGKLAIAGEVQNKMHINENIIDMTQTEDFAVGIRLGNAQNCNMQCNTLTGPYFQGSSQFTMGIQNDNAVSIDDHNTVTGFSFDVRFQGDCEGDLENIRDFAHNDFHTPFANGVNFVDLARTGNIGISNVTSRGNSWHTANPSWVDIQGYNLDLDGSGTLIGNEENEIKIASILTESDVVFSPASLSSQWLIPVNNSLTDGGCDILNPTPLLVSSPASSLFLTNPSFPEGLKSIFYQRDMDFIESNPTWVDSLSIEQETNMNTFALSPTFLLNSAYRNYQDSVEALSPLMIDLDNLTGQYWVVYHNMDSLLSSTDSLSASQQTQYNNWEYQLNIFSADIDQLTTLYSQDVQNAAISTLAEINAIIPNDLPSDALKSYFGIYLDKLILGNGINSADSSLLFDLCSSCYNEKGLAVHYAASLYASQTGHLILPSNCPTGSQMVAQADAQNTATFEIFPNPSVSKINLHYRTETECVKLIEVVDMLGRIAITDVTTGDIELELKTLQDGVYYVSSSDCDGQKSTKVIYVKH